MNVPPDKSLSTPGVHVPRLKNTVLNDKHLVNEVHCFEVHVKDDIVVKWKCVFRKSELLETCVSVCSMFYRGSCQFVHRLLPHSTQEEFFAILMFCSWGQTFTHWSGAEGLLREEVVKPLMRSPGLGSVQYMRLWYKLRRWFPAACFTVSKTRCARVMFRSVLTTLVCTDAQEDHGIVAENSCTRTFSWL